MQLSSNDCDVDRDVLNNYELHIANLLRYSLEIFYASKNIFCGVYYPTSY